MAGALPDYATSKQSPLSQSRLAPGPLVTNLGYQGQDLSQFAGQMPMNNPGYPVYPTPYASPYQQAPSHSYPQPSPVQHTHFGSPNPSQGTYNNNPYFFNPALQQYQYYSGQHGPASQIHHVQDSHFTSSPGRGPNQVYGQGAFSQDIPFLMYAWRAMGLLTARLIRSTILRLWLYPTHIQT